MRENQSRNVVSSVGELGFPARDLSNIESGKDGLAEILSARTISTDSMERMISFADAYSPIEYFQ